MYPFQIGVADSGHIRKIVRVKLWKWEPENLPSVIHSIRTAIAATASLIVARLFGLPEAYLAAIATLAVIQSTLGATLLISVERVAATALGALAEPSWQRVVYSKRLCLCRYGLCARTFVRCLSHGKERVSLREHHARDHFAHSAFKRRMDHCAPPVL